MRLIFSVAFILIAHTAFSQTFEKYYQTAQDDIVYDAIEINDEEIVFILNYGIYSPADYQTKLFRLNQFSGEFTDSINVTFNFPEYSLTKIGNMFLLGDSTLLIVGQCINKNTGDYQIFISQYDTDFNYITAFVTGDPETNETFFDVILSGDSTLVFSGMEEPHVLLIEERNINGELIKKETYNQEGGFLASTLFELPYKNKYHLYRFWDNDHSYCILDKNDLSIDTIIEYPLGFLPRNTISGLDTSYYYVAGRQLGLYPDTLGDYLSFLKVGSNGQIIEQFNYEIDGKITYYTYKSFSYNSNNIYFGGSYPCTWNPPLEFYPEQRWILIYKLTHNGEIAWQKFYKGDVNYMPYKVLATNDGGALIFSTRYDWNDPNTYQRDLHILKIDSSGYYTPLTSTAKELVQMTKQILVYPNPVENEVNFVFGLYKDLTISIFDLPGKRVFSNTFLHSAKIDVSHFKPGVYPYVISGENGFYEEGRLIKK